MSPTNLIKKALHDLLDQEVFSFLNDLAKEFPQAETYLVGGAVRDIILGRETKDYDFVIRHVTHQELSAFLTKHGQVDYVGRVFGVFKFVPNDAGQPFEAIDIALPRTEQVHTGTGAYKDFAVQTDPALPIERDLERRDFSINAIAVNVVTGDIIDPHDGLTAIKQKIISTVGSAEARLNEDFSRILRGLRLACQLGFTIEDKTWSALIALIKQGVLTRQDRDSIWIVPRETIGKEFVKTFHADPPRAFELFATSGLFSELIPEMDAMKNCPQPLPWHAEGDVFTHTKLAVAHLAGSKLWQKYFPDTKPNALTAIAVLLHDIAKPPCLKTPERDGTDRIRFDEHEPVGAEMVRAIAERLALSALPHDTPLHVDTNKLAWLVGHHLILLHADPENMRHTTIEKYFFSDKPGQELLQLSLCDTGATIHADTGKPYLDSLNAMLKRITEIAALKAERDRLPPALLDGHEIMRELKLPPSQKIGELLTELRELQLSGTIKTKDEARLALKKKMRA